jgi:hypothetical protein
MKHGVRNGRHKVPRKRTPPKPLSPQQWYDALKGISDGAPTHEALKAAGITRKMLLNHLRTDAEAWVDLKRAKRERRWRNSWPPDLIDAILADIAGGTSTKDAVIRRGGSYQAFSRLTERHPDLTQRYLGSKEIGLFELDDQILRACDDLSIPVREAKRQVNKLFLKRERLEPYRLRRPGNALTPNRRRAACAKARDARTEKARAMRTQDVKKPDDG